MIVDINKVLREVIRDFLSCIDNTIHPIPFLEFLLVISVNLSSDKKPIQNLEFFLFF